MVCAHCGSESHRATAAIVLTTARYAENLDIEHAKARSSRRATTEPIALECKDATNVAARPTKALRASRVLSTSAATAKARSNQRATTETTALERKLRCAMCGECGETGHSGSKGLIRPCRVCAYEVTK